MGGVLARWPGQGQWAPLGQLSGPPGPGAGGAVLGLWAAAGRSPLCTRCPGVNLVSSPSLSS